MGTPTDSSLLPMAFARRHMLVADDSRPMRFLMQRVLELAGATVDCAADGEEALALARARSYDLILIDIEMTGIDGHDVAKALRAGGNVAPLVAVSAHQGEAEISLCTASGFDAYVAKPFTPVALVEALASVLARGPSARPETPTR